MRTIYFRGISIETSEWVYGSLERRDSFDFIGFYEPTGINQQNPLGDTIWVREKVYRQTVGQFTGLKDKNGVSIFEGDLLAVTDNYTNEEATGSAPVVFSNKYAGGWVCESDAGDQLNLGTRTAYIRVVDNIHQKIEP